MKMAVESEWLKKKIEEHGDVFVEAGAPPKPAMWAVSIQGPDDLIPVASHQDATRVANSFNEWWASVIAARGGLHEFDARMWAVPVEYHGAPEDHARWVAEPSEDYAAFISVVSLTEYECKNCIGVEGVGCYCHSMGASSPGNLPSPDPREAFRAGWKVNAVGTDVHSQEYLDGCEQVDWEEYVKSTRQTFAEAPMRTNK